MRKKFINEERKYYWKKWSRDWKERRQTSNAAENGSDDHKMVKRRSIQIQSEIQFEWNFQAFKLDAMCWDPLAVSSEREQRKKNTEYSTKYKCEFAKDDLREMWNWQRCAPRSLCQSRLFSIKSVLLHPFASDAQYIVVNSSLSFHRVAMRERAQIQFEMSKKNQ